MEAFKTINIDKANFLSVMFFVVACGNLVAYSIAGWTAKMIAQVRLFREMIRTNSYSLILLAYHEDLPEPTLR